MLVLAYTVPHTDHKLHKELHFLVQSFSFSSMTFPLWQNSTVGVNFPKVKQNTAMQNKTKSTNHLRRDSFQTFLHSFFTWTYKAFCLCPFSVCFTQDIMAVIRFKCLIETHCSGWPLMGKISWCSMTS